MVIKNFAKAIGGLLLVFASVGGAVNGVQALLVIPLAFIGGFLFVSGLIQLFYGDDK